MKYIEHERYSNGVAVIRFNHPEQRNALNTEMLQNLLLLLQQLRDDEATRTLIFSTTDIAGLCAGADINELLDHAGGIERMKLFNAFYAAVEVFPVPTIAVCVGNCVGAGAELVAGCDLRVGGDNLKLAWAGARLGVPVGPARLVPLIGLSKAKELIFTGRVIRTEEASELGLLSASVPAAQAETKALELAGSIVQYPAEGLRTLKQMFRDLEESAQRVAHENQLLEAFQRNGTGLPQNHK